VRVNLGDTPKPRDMGEPPSARGADGVLAEGGKLSFEDSIRRLSEIVEALEGGELPLEDSLRLFEEGIKLARTSQNVLDHAERRVEELLSVDEHGNPVVREVDLE
jgi:exodeoxyribonuclease VII small subunit